MKLEPVTNLDKRNKTRSKKVDDDIMSANCDVMIIFLIYGQFGAIFSKKRSFFAKKNWHQQNLEGSGTKKYIFYN